jgi:dTDP-4-amino-4,6-dideoxygalactose transaminase
MKRIPLTQLVLGHEELEQVAAVLESGHLVSGPRVAEFEARMSAYLGGCGAVGVSSGTSAIQTALMALDLGPGDEVVVPDFCFPSVASSVIHSGADVVLCDVNPLTFNMDVDRVQLALSVRTRAVLVVHQFGIPCDAIAIQDMAGCAVIEDAACALGAQGETGLCGTQTQVGCFSFHPRKMLTTAEGGLVTSRDPDVIDRCRWIRSHGFRRGSDGAGFEELGLAARMSDVHAAIGLAQLDRLESIIAGRARSAAMYRELLGDLPGIADTRELFNSTRVYQSMVVSLTSGNDRDRVIASLGEKGIESTVGTYAIHQQKPFVDCRIAAGGLAGSIEVAQQSLTLPLWPDMEAAIVERVADALREALD